MTAPTIPAGAWDTHIHVFEPEKFPYGLPRSYTPKAATLHEYPFGKTRCDSIVIVQATVQGHAADPLRSVLNAPLPTGCTKVRGLCTVDLDTVSDKELDDLHAAGVRGFRLHEVSWGHGDQNGAAAISSKIKAAAAKVARLGWIIDVFSDVKTWAAMDSMIRKELDPRIKLLADHFGGAFPGHEQLEEFSTFTGLIRDGLLHVKLSGFERLYHGHANGIEAIEPVAKAIIAAGPKQIVYGSDWPHTQLGVSRVGKTDEQRLNDIEGFRDVPDGLHIQYLRKWIPDDGAWEDFWVNNPAKLFE
ncbi:hypothetical protein GQ53DRAFT_673077 [Thozetella sp. PMI_491]|nr:hypothetical protein GQ53DRAFT_673077 [Thozetella sp. PMI_491]